jgi:hypothetical protein
MAAALAKPAPIPRAVKVRGSKARADLQQINSSKTNQGKNELFKEGGSTMKKMNMGGYADGGMTMVNRGGKMVPDFAADGKGKMAKGGMAKDDMKQDKGMMQKAVNKHEGRLHKGQPMTKLASGGKVKRMAEGGDVNEQEDTATEGQPAAKPSSFKEAFASARKGGGKTFEFNGKKYTTELASSAASKPAAKSAGSNYSNEGRNKTPSAPADVTKMSVSERFKASRSKSREGTTDTRSVNDRIRSAFGMAKGGMANGGSFRSSANGIAQRGKTRGKVC